MVAKVFYSSVMFPHRSLEILVTSPEAMCKLVESCSDAALSSGSLGCLMLRLVSCISPTLSPPCIDCRLFRFPVIAAVVIELRTLVTCFICSWQRRIFLSPGGLRLVWDVGIGVFWGFGGSSGRHGRVAFSSKRMPTLDGLACSCFRPVA